MDHKVRRSDASEHWTTEKKRHTQLEEGIGDLEHQYMRVTMVMDDEYAFYGAPHAKVLIVILQTL
jgi:hypothetical protein